MIYGYARISTPQQSIDRQIRNIFAASPGALVIQEVYTGTTSERPEWIKLKKRLKKSDAIIFDSVSRMSRCAEEGLRDYEELFDRNIILIFIKEPHINTSVYYKAIEQSIALTGTNVDLILEGINKYIRAIAREQIKIAFDQAEKEVKDLRQRTSEGMLTAKINGSQIGAVRGRKLQTRKGQEIRSSILRHSRDFNGSLSDADLIKLIGCSRNTYFKYKKALRYD